MKGFFEKLFYNSINAPIKPHATATGFILMLYPVHGT